MSKKVNLVFEGGGVKGIGLVGATAVLEEQKFVPHSVAGTSAGAINAALLAAGYSAAEMWELIGELDYEQFKDKGAEDRIPLAGAPLSVLWQQGVYEGERFLEWIRDLLAERDIATFGDLVHEDPESEPSRHRLRVIASDITDRRMLVLPDDAVRFGIEPDSLGVAEAVRMSMSIPLFFEPWRWQPAAGRDHLIVDGGVLSNFPVWLFDDRDDPGSVSIPTFGLMLVEPEPERSVAERLEPIATSSRWATVDFIRGLVETMMEAHDRMYLESASYVRTIKIPTLGVRTTEFDLSPKRRRELFDSGREAAESFLDEFDPGVYEAVVGATEPVGRGELAGIAEAEAVEQP